MKKIFLLIFISLCFCQNIAFCANTTQKADITKIENNIFGYDYNNEKMEARLARLEKSIYGKVSSGNNETRLKKIINDIAANEIGSEIKPSEDTYKEKEELADSSVQYPYVDEIEQKLFNKTYGNRDFHTRIVTIERKLFGKIYDVDDYATRMERIKAKMEPNSHLANKSRNYSETENIAENTSQNDIIEVPREYSTDDFTKFTTDNFRYNNIKNLNGISEDEIARLEYENFGTEFSADDKKTRLKRLKSVAKAKKSYAKYDSQKFQQRFSTAMEIGAMILMILAMVL